MKHLFRTVVLFLTLLITILGCQQEDLNESQQSSIENGVNSLIRVGSLKDFKNLNQYITKDIIDVYNSSLQFRTATEDTNGFTIIGDEITQVTTDSLTTFTLKIVKDNQPPNSFSNLIISFGLDNSSSAFIINYFPTENYMSSIESNPQAVFEGQVNSEYIDYNEDLNGLLGLNRLSCWYIATTFCNWGGEEHLAGGNCTEAFMYPGSQKVCVGSSEYQPERDNSLGGGGGGGENSSIPSTNPKVVEPCEISSNGSNGNSINLTENGCDDEFSVINVDVLNNIKNQIEDCLVEDYNTEWFDTASYDDIEDIGAYLNGNCSEVSKALVLDFLEIKDEIINAKFERYLELLSLIDENPWVLLQNCAEQNGLDISNYTELYEFELPTECQTRLNNLGEEYYHQPIEEGNVPLANIDYYSVEITTYPDFDNDGNLDNEGQIYEAFRENFIDFASGELENFQFNCNIPFNLSNTADIFWDFVPFSSYDETLFLSNNPISAILLIQAGADGLLTNMSADEGAIIVSDFTANDWTISTIYTEETETQPFSGNRQWGWLINDNNNLEIFTRAVDVARVSDLIKSDPFNDEECQQNDYYNIAEATWENMQNEITSWINQNGGQANIIPKTAIRIDKAKISDLLESNEVLNEIPCD